MPQPHDFPRERGTDVDRRIGRETNGKHDYLAPTNDQANMVMYCAAYNATSCDQILSALMTTPTILDVALTDTNGGCSDYTEGCHSMLARGRNRQLDRSDSLFASGCPAETVLLNPEAAIAELAELCCLPIEKCLVEHLRHWHGAQLLPDTWGLEQVADRPEEFNRDRTILPEQVRFTPMPPQVLLRVYGLEKSRQLVKAAVVERAQMLNATRAERSGSSKVLGRKGCDTLDPLGSRKLGDSKPRPHFAGTPQQVEAALDELRLWREFYADCRACFAAGQQHVVFPAGTVMFRKLGANCDPLPPSRVQIPPFKHCPLPLTPD